MLAYFFLNYHMLRGASQRSLMRLLQMFLQYDIFTNWTSQQMLKQNVQRFIFVYNTKQHVTQPLT